MTCFNRHPYISSTRRPNFRYARGMVLSSPAALPTSCSRRLPRLRFSLLTFAFFILMLGSAVATCVRGFDPWIRLRRFETTKPNYQPHAPTLAALSADKLHVFSIAEDGFMRVFDVGTGTLVWEAPFDFKYDTREARFIDNDSAIESSKQDRIQHMFFDAATGKQIIALDRLSALNQIPIPSKPIASSAGVAYSPDGTRRVERVLRQPMSDSGWDLIDASSERVIASIRSPKGWPWGAAFSADSRRFATAAYDNTVHVRDATDGRDIAIIEPQPRTWCYAVNFSDDGNDLLIVRFHDILLYHRQWPESRWGHAYRTEIWATIVFFVLWVWRLLGRRSEQAH